MLYEDRRAISGKELLVLLFYFRDISGPMNVVTLVYCVHRLQPVIEVTLFQNGRVDEKKASRPLYVIHSS